MADDPVIHTLLAQQDGLITTAQAERYGLPARTMCERGWWRPAPRVYLADGHPWTDRARVRAAGLWAGERGFVSGPAAAWWHGMLDGRPPAAIEVTVPRRCGLRGYRDVRLRRQDLDPRDQRNVRGIWLTDRPLTALETAITVPDGSQFLDRALQRHVGFEQIRRAYCRRLGAKGGPRIAALLIAAADRADSAAERLVFALLRDAGITGWVRNHPFQKWLVDVAFPAQKLAIEVDGWAWHTGADRFRNDRHKGNALVRAGWRVLRFTWHDLTNRPGYVHAEILAALAGS